MIFLALSNEQVALIILGICVIPILVLIIYAITIVIRKNRKLNLEREQEVSTSDDQSQRHLFLDVFGGAENIQNVMVQMSRISVTVNDLDKVQVEQLKDLGAGGVLLVDNVVKCSFGDRASYVYNLLKKDDKND